MDHDDALERIEIAAAEPGGLDRLMAGDAPDSAAVAGHLAGCSSCVVELERVRRTSAIVREVVRSEPDPELRERTLAFVRAVGRDRSGEARRAEASGTVPGLAVVPPSAAEGAAAVPPSAAAPAVPAAAASAVPAAAAPVLHAVGTPAGPTTPVPPAGPATSVSATTRSRFPAVRWLAAVAAALLIVGVAGFAAGGGLRGPDTAVTESVSVLQDATKVALHLATQPDARSVALAPTGGGSAAGTLAFSPSTGALIAVATGLTEAPPGAEYACWVEVNGQRRRLGEMYGTGGLQAWSGWSDGLASLPPGTVFGVSLVAADGGPGTPVLTGTLEQGASGG